MSYPSLKDMIRTIRICHVRKNKTRRTNHGQQTGTHTMTSRRPIIESISITTFYIFVVAGFTFVKRKYKPLAALTARNICFYYYSEWRLVPRSSSFLEIKRKYERPSKNNLYQPACERLIRFSIPHHPHLSLQHHELLSLPSTLLDIILDVSHDSYRLMG